MLNCVGMLTFPKYTILFSVVLKLAFLSGHLTSDSSHPIIHPERRQAVGLASD
jgi:hypothetical protein